MSVIFEVITSTGAISYFGVKVLTNFKIGNFIF